MHNRIEARDYPSLYAHSIFIKPYIIVVYIGLLMDTNMATILELTEQPCFYMNVRGKEYRMDKDPEHIGVVGFIVFKTPTGGKRRFGCIIDIPSTAGYHDICDAGNVWRAAVKRIYKDCKEIYTIGWTHRVPWIQGIHVWAGAGNPPPYYEGAFRESYFNRK